MKELKDKRAYFHWGKSYLLNEALALNDSVSELLRERNELAAQVERLRGALDLMCDRAAQVDGWESFPSKWIDEALEVYAELPAQSLEAVKREIAILTLEDYDAALSSFEMTVPEYIKARLS